MSVEKNNESIKNIEITKESLSNEINESINELSKIDPDNESIKKLKDVTEKFSDNKEALATIAEWLKNINEKVNQISSEWENKISMITKWLFKKLEELENQDLSIDDKLNNL